MLVFTRTILAYQISYRIGSVELCVSVRVGAGRAAHVHDRQRNCSQETSKTHAQSPGMHALCMPPQTPACGSFLARDVIYTSRAYATMSVSVCL